MGSGKSSRVAVAYEGSWGASEAIGQFAVIVFVKVNKNEKMTLSRFPPHAT